MNLADTVPEIDALVKTVGFSRIPPSFLDQKPNPLERIDVPHAVWWSNFALLVVIDALDKSTSDIDGIIKVFDGAIAEILDWSAGSGIDLDAHLCFFADSAVSSRSDSFGDQLSEVTSSMFVSRKYLLDREVPVSEFASRVTVLWPSFGGTPNEATAPIAYPGEVLDLYTRIADSSGSRAADSFLEAHP